MKIINKSVHWFLNDATLKSLPNWEYAEFPDVNVALTQPAEDLVCVPFVVSPRPVHFEQH